MQTQKGGTVLEIQGEGRQVYGFTIKTCEIAEGKERRGHIVKPAWNREGKQRQEIREERMPKVLDILARTGW